MTEHTPVELRFLSQEEGIEAGLTDMDRCIDAVGHVFELYDRNRVVMGDSGYSIHGHVTTFPGELRETEELDPGPDRRFSAMPAYVGGDVRRMGIKWYGSNVTNPAERGLPRSIHTITLNDPDSGQPVFLMEGGTASAMRTGAVAGVGAAAIQGDRATTAAVIGPGVIGQTSALGLDSALESLERLYAYHPERAKADAFAAEIGDDLGAALVPTDSADEAVGAADVIVVAAAGDPPPRIDPDWIGEDALVIPLGDLRTSLDAFDADRIFCDVRENALEFADHLDWEITNALGAAVGGGGSPDIDRSDLRALHELVTDTDDGDTVGRSILYAPGLPMEDVAWTNEIYETAESEDIGRTLRLFSEPYFSKPY